MDNQIHNAIVSFIWGIADDCLRGNQIDTMIEADILAAVIEKFISPDISQTQIGYEISFTKYFYTPVELRPMEEIMESLKALEREADDMMAEIMEGIQ